MFNIALIKSFITFLSWIGIIILLAEHDSQDNKNQITRVLKREIFIYKIQAFQPILRML